MQKAYCEAKPADRIFPVHTLRHTLPVIAAFIPVGFAFGVLAVKSGLPPLWAILMSLFVLAGSSQFIAVGMIASGAGIWSIIITTFIVNLRHLLMSASLAPWMSDWSRKRIACFSFGLIDETYAIHISRFLNKDTDKHDSLAINLTTHAAWVLSTVSGVYFSTFVTDIKPVALDYTLTALFIALLVPQLKLSRSHIIAAVSAAVCAAAATLLGAGQWGIIGGTVIGASIALFFHTDQKGKK